MVKMNDVQLERVKKGEVKMALSAIERLLSMSVITDEERATLQAVSNILKEGFGIKKSIFRGPRC